MSPFWDKGHCGEKRLEFSFGHGLIQNTRMSDGGGFKRIPLAIFLYFFLIVIGVRDVIGASKVLIVCDDVSDPKTLDPQKQFTEKNRTILQHVFEELIRINPDGKLIPHLATKWERVSPLTVRLFLRPGVKFHNGEDFTAESVKFTIERYLDPRTGFPGTPFISSISSATVVDPLTVDVHTHYPDGLLLHRLASIVLIVPLQYVSNGGPDVLGQFPVGTGPFRFDRWEKGRKVVLVANESYWKPGVPKVSELQF